MKEKITDFLKRIKVLWDAYKVLLGVLALFGAIGGVGYYSTEKAPHTASQEVTTPLPVTIPAIPKQSPHMTMKQVEDTCKQLIKEHVTEYH